MEKIARFPGGTEILVDIGDFFLTFSDYFSAFPLQGRGGPKLLSGDFFVTFQSFGDFGLCRWQGEIRTLGRKRKGAKKLMCMVVRRARELFSAFLLSDVWC